MMLIITSYYFSYTVKHKWYLSYLINSIIQELSNCCHKSINQSINKKNPVINICICWTFTYKYSRLLSLYIISLISKLSYTRSRWILNPRPHLQPHYYNRRKVQLCYSSLAIPNFASYLWKFITTKKKKKNYMNCFTAPVIHNLFIISKKTRAKFQNNIVKLHKSSSHKLKQLKLL